MHPTPRSPPLLPSLPSRPQPPISPSPRTRATSLSGTGDCFHSSPLPWSGLFPVTFPCSARRSERKRLLRSRPTRHKASMKNTGNGSRVSRASRVRRSRVRRSRNRASIRRYCGMICGSWRGNGWCWLRMAISWGEDVVFKLVLGSGCRCFCSEILFVLGGLHSMDLISVA